MKAWWSLAVLLVLLPLTMAPKIALVPLPEDPALHLLQVTAQVPRTSMRAGSVTTTVFRTENLTNAPLGVSLGVDAVLDGERSKSITFIGLQHGCEFAEGSENQAICFQGTIRPGQAKTVKITVRATEPGDMSFRVKPDIISGSSPHGVNANDVVIHVVQ